MKFLKISGLKFSTIYAHTKCNYNNNRFYQFEFKYLSNNIIKFIIDNNWITPAQHVQEICVDAIKNPELNFSVIPLIDSKIYGLTNNNIDDNEFIIYFSDIQNNNIETNIDLYGDIEIFNNTKILLRSFGDCTLKWTYNNINYIAERKNNVWKLFEEFDNIIDNFLINNTNKGE